ncbi:hypothetical protein CFC21_000100 [Triticum aestivum]|uniref:Uncharacterized protein n=3 Tax=Triticum TaxID=4564 RepID=A0A9R0UMA9_TRITD|nr:hypothetical protein TRIUR3_03665 [Triticum urartu]KAF6981640.1 hypothetical protein CFC21_000100 [Triticum aestivum]VAH00243.1 unnamed protein product [Triticum turgidum subsp. durum]
MTTFFFGRSPLSVSDDSIVLTMSMPSRTWPKTTCLPSSHGVCKQGSKQLITLTVQMKNWLPLVFGPAFAMLSTPGPV